MADKTISFSVSIDGITTEQQELAKLEVELKKLRKAKQDLLKESQKEGQNTADNQKKLALLTTEINRNTTAQKQLKQQITPTQSSFVKLGKTLLATLGLAGGLTAGVRALFNVFKNGLKTSIEFEYAMSQVKAITNATSEEFSQLSENAIKMGSSTKYTAIEVASLQKEYAKLGFTVTEIVNVTQATLDLAAATGTDLAFAAIIAGQTLRQFNLDATQMARVTDVMTKSFSTSALDMDKFSTAMMHAGPVAKAVGDTVEQTTAKLAVLANSGLDASISGTSLRNIYLELEKRGLSWNDAMAKIQGSQNRASTSLELFGKRGAVAGLILANDIQGIEDYNKSLNDATGTTEKMAGVMLDNLKGATTIMKSEWEALTLRINDTNGALKTFVDSISTTVSGIAKKGRKDLDVLFDDKKIETFNDRFRFFIATGVGYWKAAKMARVNSNEEAQSLKNEFVKIGASYTAEMDKITENRLANEEKERQANDKRLRDIQDQIDKETEAYEIKRLIEKESLITSVENAKDNSEELKIILKKQLDFDLKETDITEKQKIQLRLAYVKKIAQIDKSAIEDAKKNIILNHKNIKDYFENLWKDMVDQEEKTVKFSASLRKLLGVKDDFNQLRSNDKLFNKQKAEARAAEDYEIETRKQHEEKILSLKLAGLNGAEIGANAAFSAKRNRLQAEMEAELSNINLTEEQKVRIKRKYAIEQQKVDVKQAFINTALAIGNALATTKPFIPAGLFAAGLAAIKGGAQVIAIKTQGYKGGGKVKRGIPINTGTVDNKLIAVNDTETVLTAKHVAMLGGSGAMRRIKVPGYVEGGYIGQRSPDIPSSGYDFDSMVNAIRQIQIRLDVNKINAAQREIDIIEESQRI